MGSGIIEGPVEGIHAKSETLTNSACSQMLVSLQFTC